MASKIKADQFETLDGSGNITLNNSVTMASTKTLPAASLTGTVPTASLGSGTASSSVFLRGDGSWQAAGSTSASDLTSGTLPMARLSGTLPALAATNLTAIPAANITGTLPAISGANLTGISGEILSYAAGQINLTSGIAHSGSTTKTATGVTFAITSTVTNSNFIIHASGWTPHMNPTSSGGNIGAAHWLYRKVNTGSYSSATSYHPYSDYITAGDATAYNWDNMTGQMHIYDSAITHTAGDVITYQFYVEPYNGSDSGYFHHTGGDGASTVNWSILEVN